MFVDVVLFNSVQRDGERGLGLLLTDYRGNEWADSRSGKPTYCNGINSDKNSYIYCLDNVMAYKKIIYINTVCI